jgi:hypothetical protein
VIGLVFVVLVGGAALAWALDRELNPRDMAPMKPKTWPELQWPTPGEWLDWLLSNPRHVQLVIAARVLDNADRAHVCLVMDHESAMKFFTSTGAPR